MVENIYNKFKGIISNNPKQLYKQERDLLDKPFYFPGNNQEAVLLIHGWTSVPYEVRRLGKYLNENGYTVFGPMLSGHGTVPKDLESTKWENWLCDVTRAYEDLEKNHEKVYVMGTSIGANLAVILAKNKPKISGLVLMAMPYGIKMEKIVVPLVRLISFFKKYNKKIYPPTFGSFSTITRLISYQTYPIKSALETFKFIKISRNELEKINQPCFILQSISDHIVSKNSLEKIYEKIGSKIKEKKYIHRAYHTFISDIENENVFEDILNFIKKIK